MAEEEGHNHHSLWKRVRTEGHAEADCVPSFARGPLPEPSLTSEPSFAPGLLPEPSVSSITKLVVRPWAPQTNPNVTIISISPDQLEGGEEIDEEEAICKLCSSIFREENITKIKCKCISGLALAHEACVGDSCDVCGLQIQKTRIRLDRVPVPARHEEESRRRSRRKSRSLCFKR